MRPLQGASFYHAAAPPPAPRSHTARARRRSVRGARLHAGNPDATAVRVTADTIAVTLCDGRDIAVPLAWYPRLLHATPEERARWRWLGGGEGMHWDDLDEDISVENLLAGRRSGESEASFARWLASRTTK